MKKSALTPLIAITSGEPAGVGPELCATLARRAWPARLVIVGDLPLLRERAHCVGMGDCFIPFAPDVAPEQGKLEVLHIPLAQSVQAGLLNSANARYVLATLDAAVDGCMQGQFAAMVTAPVQKSIINEAGIAFTGHTEYLAERTHTARVVMMLAGLTGTVPDKQHWLRVALATTHLPLSAVPAAITPAELDTTLQILHRDLQQKFGLPHPRILVAGLNPHAGEGGHMGREEIEVLTPVLDHLRTQGMNLIGPLPADTLFTPRHLAEADAVLAMYHDQGLPTLKYATFGHGINVTLGLPIIRTSVDHGTALDLAGTGRADSGSLYCAVECALDMAHRVFANEI